MLCTIDESEGTSMTTERQLTKAMRRQHTLFAPLFSIYQNCSQPSLSNATIVWLWTKRHSPSHCVFENYVITWHGGMQLYDRKELHSNGWSD